MGKGRHALGFSEKTSDLLSHPPLQRGPTVQKGNVREERETFVFIDIDNLSLILENGSEHPDVALACHYTVL